VRSAQRHIQISSDRLHYTVTLWMNGCDPVGFHTANAQNPADCSNAFEPNFTFSSERRFLNAVLVSIDNDVLATVGVMPETRPGVLRGGVKIHTHIVHTAFYRFIHLLEQLLIDIMLVPDTNRFRIILTAQQARSCKRRPMLIAPRTVTSRSENSVIATASGIDAPDSFTITLIGLRSIVFKTSEMNSSVHVQPCRCQSRSARYASLLSS